MNVAPAHAAWGAKTSDTVVVPVAPVTNKPTSSTTSKKVVQVLVTAGAVVAGSAASKKVRAFDNNDNENNGDDDAGKLIREDEKIPNVVPKDKPSPLPLSSEFNKSKTPTDANKKNPILVKDLDSKIEMLRAREEQAKANAEQKRLEDIAKAEEVRKQEQLDMNARIAAEAEKVKQSHRDREERVQKQKEQEREVKLAKLEQGKKEQKRLEDITKAEEVRKQEQIDMDARIAAEAEKVEREQREREEREQRQREEKKMAELEQEKEEQGRLEQIKQSQVVAESNVVKQEEVPKNTNNAMSVNGGDVRPAKNIGQAKDQPKSIDEEQMLKEKYGNMDLEERAFNILVDLGMVDLHSDPADLEENDDDDFM